jgi:dUTP pyrophosphatase
MEMNCFVCGNLIPNAKPSRLERVKYGLCCSRECRAEFMKTSYSGSNNPNYKKTGLSNLTIFFNDKINKLKHTAAQRNIDFDLKSKELENLYNKQNGLCYYTGIPLSLVSTKAWKQKRQADFDVLSVDRIDSNKGYFIKNIVLCCSAIDKMKGTSSLLETQGLLNLIASKRQLVCHIKIKKLYENSQSPIKSKVGDAGYDLMASSVEDLGDRLKVGTGLSVQPASGWYCEVYGRSSNVKKGLMLMNSVGIIDNGYTGEIFCIFYKTRKDSSVNIGDRIAQLIPKQYAMVEFEEVEDLDDTQRGTGGFGSTGK